MGKFTVIPKDTFDGLQLEAGVLLNKFNPASVKAPEDADIICATTGDITVSCTPTYSDLSEGINNCMANTKELKHLDGWACEMSFTALSMSPANVKLSLGAADVSDNKITPRRDLKLTDFTDTIWWVGDRTDGGCVAICLKNALSTGGFSLKTTKNGNGQVSYTLTGHVSINAQDVVPMEFYSIDPEE